MILTIITLVIVLGIIILFHEIGHFVSAKKMGVDVEEFGVGFPPRIFGKKYKGTIYSLNWIPIGGFVKIKGEQGEGKDDPRSFASKKIWRRAIILSAGVFMNFVLAFIIFSISFGIGSPTIIDESISPNTKIKDEKIQIVEVVDDSPADRAELKVGDIIISLDNKSIKETEDFSQYTAKKTGQEIILKIKRGDQELEKKLTPEKDEELERGIVGVWLVKTGLVSYPWYQSIWMGLKSTVSITWQILVALYEIIKNLLITHQTAVDIAGPVGIAVITGQVAKMGFVYILQFAALLSINLAIINFLPFPALDGGRVLFLVIEKIRGKPVNRKVEATIHNIGFILLILLLVFITFKDVSRFGENIKNFFSNIF